jgi:hypothetical protein
MPRRPFRRDRGEGGDIPMSIYTYLDTRCSTLADRQLALPGAMRGWVAAAAGDVAMHLACGVDVERDR